MQTNHRAHLTLVEPAAHWRSVEEVKSALAGLAYRFAAEVTEEALPSRGTAAAALREPVSMASVLFDLAEALSVPAPAVVLDALDDPAPF